LEAIFYVLRTGIPWKALPKEFGASSAVHRYFRFWYREGFFKALWDAGLGTYEEAAGIQWAWLSADESIGEGAAQDTGERGKPQRQTPYARRRRHHQLPASGFNVCD
jgi:hypothetical protein